MSIKINNAIVIDDSRNIADLNSAEILGPISISVDDAASALRVTQTGSGSSLLVKDSGNNSPFVINADGRVGIGTDTPLESTRLTINANDPRIALRQQGSSTDGVFGYTLREVSGTLSFDKSTSTTLEDWSSVLLIRSVNCVSINATGTPLYPLEVRENMVIQNANNEGIQFIPELNASSSNFLWARSSTQGFNRGLQIVGETIGLYTGTNDQTAATLRMLSNQTLTVVYNTLRGNQFTGPGADWYNLGTVTASGSAVTINLSNEFKNYTVFYDHIRGTSDAVLRVDLLDSGASLIGSGFYRFGGLFFKSNSSTNFFSFGADAQAFWSITPTNITPNGVEGSASGELTFINLTSTDRYKSFNLLGMHYTVDAGTASEQLSIGGGVLDSTTAAASIRFVMSSGSFAGGTFTLYGMRT